MNPLEERVISSTIGPDCAGAAVLDYLARRFTYRDRDAWGERLAAGELRLNGIPARPDDVLAANDVLSYHPGILPEPPVDAAYRIAYEDDVLLVVDKPGDLPTHPAGAFYRHTLWFMLTSRFGPIHPVNRLDRETSGLLIVAKDARTAARMAKTAVEKSYLALVFGDFAVPVDADGFLIPDAASAVRKKRRFVFVPPDPAPDGTQTASTRLEPVKRHDNWTLVRAMPRTGRMHQIRATLCSLGFPLVGDKLYGPDDQLFLKIRDDRFTDDDRRRLIMPRQALHAAQLRFRHPVSGETIEVASPLPEDFPPVFR